MKRERRAAAAASTAGTWWLQADTWEFPTCLTLVACKVPFREMPEEDKERGFGEIFLLFRNSATLLLTKFS